MCEFFLKNENKLDKFNMSYSYLEKPTINWTKEVSQKQNNKKIKEFIWNLTLKLDIETI